MKSLEFERYLEDKNIMVVGMARSGLAAAKELVRLKARVIVNDSKDKEALGDIYDELLELGVKSLLGTSPEGHLDHIDILILSPGVPMDLPFIEEARDKGILIMGEIELAYRLCKAPILAITGTNGKTTSTALTGEIMKKTSRKVHVLGNIGIPFIGALEDIGEEDLVVLEISSFQLEGVLSFNPQLAAILNISEDHLDRHKTMDKYISLKKDIASRQGEEDFLILNGDNPILNSFGKDIEGKEGGPRTFYFSRKGSLARGAWISEGYIILNIAGEDEKLISIDEIFIPGPHNLENAMAASLMARLLGAPLDIIRETLKEFRGVEHRIELVDTIDGVTFYNDSKGTNIDASLKAIKSMKKPTVLIAGGFDKGSGFDSLIEGFDGLISHLITLGQTASSIEASAKSFGFTDVKRASSLEEAVKISFKLAKRPGNVLLSPACASWGMFKDFEERGKIFKEEVYKLKDR